MFKKQLPKISVVMTTYRPESKEYLDLAIKSVKECYYPKELIEIILVGKPSYMPTYEGVRTVTPFLESFHNPVGLNYGVKHAAVDSEYILMLNDDVVLTHKSLFNMAMTARVLEQMQCPLILSPISPCDNYWKYLLNFQINTGGGAVPLMERFYTIDKLRPYLSDLLFQDSSYQQGVMFTDTLCLYANLITKSLWHELGGFDENFLTGYDDTDFCLRSRQKGAKLGICMDSLMWHFGGASTNHTLTPDMRKQTEEYFHKKWQQAQPNLTI